MIRKKIFLLIIFNVSLVFYFISIISIKDSVQLKRAARVEVYKENSKLPFSFLVRDLAEWDSENHNDFHRQIQEWITYKKGYVAEESQAKYSAIEEQSQKLFSRGHFLISYQSSLETYQKNLAILKEKLKSGKWTELLKKVETISIDPKNQELQKSKEDLQVVLDKTLSSRRSQVNKEAVLGLTAEVEKSLFDLKFSQDIYQDYLVFDSEIKKVDRHHLDKLVFDLEKHPYESASLFLSGWMLFMLINGWLTLSGLGPEKSGSPVCSLKMTAAALAKKISEMYTKETNPFGQIRWEVGETIFSSKLNNTLALSLSSLHNSLGGKAEVSIGQKSSVPYVLVKFQDQKTPLNVNDISAELLNTHKTFSHIGGEVEWEADFDDTVSLKTIQIVYQLPKAVSSAMGSEFI